MYCSKCGAIVTVNDRFCPKCGFSQPQTERGNNTYQQSYNQPPQQPQDNENISERSGLVVLLLAIFLGYLGVHSFYTGKTGIGIAQLLTAGGCGIWVIIDIVMLVTGSYFDAEGKKVKLQ